MDNNYIAGWADIVTWPNLTGKMGRNFPVREKSTNLGETGKSGEFQTNVFYYVLVIFKGTVYNILYIVC